MADFEETFLNDTDPYGRSPDYQNKEDRGLFAAEVSVTERYLRVIFGTLFALLTTGVVLGLPPVSDVLMDEGAYHNLCPEGTPADVTCAEQNSEFVFIFTVGASCFNMVAFLSGRILDTQGPRITLLLGSFIFALGLFIVGNSPNFFFDFQQGYVVGFALVGSGGPFIFQSMLHLANLFPQHSGAITTLMVAALEGACVVFALFNFLYTEYGINHHVMFFIYAGVVAFLGLVYMHPSKAFQKTIIATTNDTVDYRSHMKPLGLWEQVQTWHFAFFATYMVTGLLRVNFFTATIELFMEDLTEENDVVKQFVSVFGWILPIGGILFVPVVGYCLDHFSVTKNLVILSTLGLVMNVCALIEVLQFQLVTFVLMSIFRAACFSTLCVFLTNVFGWKNYGGLLGLSNFIAGVVNFVLVPLQHFVTNQLDGSFFYVNIVFVVIAVLRFYMPYKFFNEQRDYENKERIATNTIEAPTRKLSGLN